MSMVFLDATNSFILGAMPESLDILIFGVLMILIAVGLRRVLSKIDEQQTDENLEPTAQKVISNQEISQTFGNRQKHQVQR